MLVIFETTILLFCLGFKRQNSVEEQQNFLDFVQELQSSTEDDQSLPEWLCFQPKTKNVYEQRKLSDPSPYDIILGEFKYLQLAGKVNTKWLRNDKKVKESTFKVFNSFLREILKRYADELHDGFPIEAKIDHTQTLAFCNGILMTFPSIQKKYATFLQQERTGEVTFKQTTLKPFAQVYLSFCVSVN